MREIRVFVGAALCDMKAERAALRIRVAPMLHKLCRQLGVAFTFVDLCDDVTAEELSKPGGGAMQQLLYELDQCRPHAAILLGERHAAASSHPPSLLTPSPSQPRATPGTLRH